jgi:hypothetical protein
MPKLTNACGEDRRWWGVMPILPAPVMGGIAKQMEAVGFEGCFSLQIYGPPFVPMAAVAAMTDTLKVSTGIAVAGTRSPVETASAADDLCWGSARHYTARCVEYMASLNANCSPICAKS